MQAIKRKEMKKAVWILVAAAVLVGCQTRKTSSQTTDGEGVSDSAVAVTVKYATGFSVRDSADVRLVSVGKKDRFALVRHQEVQVPEGYVKVVVPIQRTLCMTALQLSNFTVLARRP